jgi:hypothetical protein
MKMKIQIKSLAILILFFSSQSLSQDANRNWFIIQDSNDKVVYIDTSNIELTDNQLFVRNIIMYRQPVFMHTLQQNVKKSKSHLLFNTEQKTYSVIGAIFYNVSGEIIGESDDVGVTSGSSNFSLKIQDDSVYDIIMKKSLEYLNTNRITVEPSEYLVKKSDEIKTMVEVDEDIKTSDLKHDVVPEIKANEIEQLKETKPKIPIPPKVETKRNEVVEVKPQIKESKPRYNSANEKAVKNLIYFDGNLYCFQVSSWKRESVAKQEVSRLSEKGYDAFYVEAEIPGRGTWYRVRVGYFSSIEEALSMQSKVK